MNKFNQALIKTFAAGSLFLSSCKEVFLNPESSAEKDSEAKITKAIPRPRFDDCIITDGDEYVKTNEDRVKLNLLTNTVASQTPYLKAVRQLNIDGIVITDVAGISKYVSAKPNGEVEVLNTNKTPSNFVLSYEVATICSGKEVSQASQLRISFER